MHCQRLGCVGNDTWLELKELLEKNRLQRDFRIPKIRQVINTYKVELGLNLVIEEDAS